MSKHVQRKKRKGGGMRPCERCLERQWTFAFLEGVVTATCKLCGNEVQFASKKAAKHPGDPVAASAPERSCSYYTRPGTLPVDGPPELAPWR